MDYERHRPFSRCVARNGSPFKNNSGFSLPCELSKLDPSSSINSKIILFLTGNDILLYNAFSVRKHPNI